MAGAHVLARPWYARFCSLVPSSAQPRSSGKQGCSWRSGARRFSSPRCAVRSSQLPDCITGNGLPCALMLMYTWFARTSQLTVPTRPRPPRPGGQGRPAPARPPTGVCVAAWGCSWKACVVVALGLPGLESHGRPSHSPSASAHAIPPHVTHTSEGTVVEPHAHCRYPPTQPLPQRGLATRCSQHAPHGSAFAPAATLHSSRRRMLFRDRVQPS